MSGKVYRKNVGDIFEADEKSAKTLIQLKVAELYVEPVAPRKTKVKAEPESVVIPVVEEVDEDAISNE